MTFPTVALATEYTGSNVADPHPVPYGATVTAGQLLISFGSNDGIGDTTTITGGPTTLGTPANAQSHGFWACYEAVDGTEDGTTFTADVTSGEEMAAVSLLINGWDGSTAPEISTIANGSSTAPNSPSLTPSWGAADTLFITVCTWDGDAGTISVWPSSYAGNQHEPQYTTVNGMACATRAINGSPEDPGAFTTTNSVGWQAFTIAVRPASGNPHYYYAQQGY